MSDDEAEVTYGIQYEGETEIHPHVIKDGVAKATFPNGDTFQGEYKDGKRDGKGVYTFNNGAVYDGEYKSNLKHGNGTMKLPDGGVYKGSWKADKRDGHGIYTYANGDKYFGDWSDDKKHGKGSYQYAATGQQLKGVWVQGKLDRGTLKNEDGTKFVGTFNDNLPDGKGVYAFANGNNEAGTYERGEWSKDSFEKPPLDAELPEVQAADLFTQYSRAIQRCVVKIDHFENIYRLDKIHDGAPNFRKVDGYPVFGTGQPTKAGFQRIFESLQEQGFEKFIWHCMRQEPIVYANDMSYAPRDKKNLNENMEFHDVDAKMLDDLQDQLTEKVRKHANETGAHTYFKDTYAENPADRKNMELTDPVSNAAEDVKSLKGIFDWLIEEKELEITAERLPIADERAPAPNDFDILVHHLKDVDESTALLFNCQMGKGRTTTGMVVAIMLHHVVRGAPEEDHDDEAEEEEAEDKEEEEQDDAEGEDKAEEKDAAAAADAQATDAAEPDLKQGEYAVILDLIKALPNGKKAKSLVDDAIDRAHHLQNLREVILYTKEMYDKETEERRKFWKRMSVNFIERYFYLVLFGAYLFEGKADDYEKSFKDWVVENNDKYLSILGTRDEGALKDFHWQ